MQRLESSQIKVRQARNDMASLEEERRKITDEREQLLAEQNQQSEQWKARYTEIAQKNEEVVGNLAEANRHYLSQVSENEKLSQHIEDLQREHREFVAKFRDMELRLEDSERVVEE